MENLKEDVKKLMGLPPYNEMSNISYGDSYFRKSLEQKYSKEAVKKMEKELVNVKPSGDSKPIKKWENKPSGDSEPIIE